MGGGACSRRNCSSLWLEAEWREARGQERGVALSESEGDGECVAGPGLAWLYREIRQFGRQRAGTRRNCSSQWNGRVCGVD